MRSRITTADALNDPLPETIAAERLRQHLQDIARERDEAYRALQEREAELARIQRIGKVGGLEVDFREGFKNRRSPEYLMIHGLPPEAVDETHEDWVSRIHPDDRDATVKHFFEALAGASEDYTAEYRIIRPSDRETRWIRVVAKIERDSDGRAIRLVGAHIDVTDQMLVRETLRESEERFRLIADSAPVPIWVTKLDRTRSFANQAYVDFVGLPYDQAIAFDWRKVLHPDDLPHVLQQSVQGEASLKPFVLEARYKDASGEWRWLRSESQPRWDATGKHIGFIGVAHDITVAKRAEIELRQLNETLEERIAQRTAELESNEARLRAILGTSNQYQGLVNLKGELLYANKTALDGIKASSADVVGKPFWDTPWFTGTHGMSAAVREAFDTVLKGEAVRMEMRLRLPIGERDFEFGMRPVLDRHGSITGAVPEAVDITERRRGEEALRQSQKMEAIGQLTGGVAHDFNNLLTIIRSATDFLRRRELPEERRRRYVDAISDTVERASKLTAQLLAFARRQPLKPQIFNVGSQVEGVAQLVRPLVGGRIEIAVEIDDADCFTVADIAQFETALINLAINARDAMDGEGRLTIAVCKVQGIPNLRTQSARGGDYIAISLADTGGGIAPENIDAIFEPFFTTKEVGKGTGLGLSMVYGIVKQTGGYVFCDSEPGAGATFRVLLPRRLADDVDEPVKIEIPKPAADLTGRGAILLVEDEEAVRAFASRALGSRGYTVLEAETGLDALRVVEAASEPIDLIVSDVIMPEMDGPTMLTELRKRGLTAKVIFVSGYADDAFARNLPEGQDFVFLPKPFSLKQLIETVKGLMN